MSDTNDVNFCHCYDTPTGKIDDADEKGAEIKENPLKKVETCA